MAASMRSARLHEPGQPLRIDTVEIPEPRPRDVLVRVKACGIIPNMNAIFSGRLWNHLPPLPASVGLDAAGVIAKVGSEAADVAVGDRVYVNPWLSCGTCPYCRAGEPMLCSAAAFQGYFGFFSSLDASALGLSVRRFFGVHHCVTAAAGASAAAGDIRASRALRLSRHVVRCAASRPGTRRQLGRDQRNYRHAGSGRDVTRLGNGSDAHSRPWPQSSRACTIESDGAGPGRGARARRCSDRRLDATAHGPARRGRAHRLLRAQRGRSEHAEALGALKRGAIAVNIGALTEPLAIQPIRFMTARLQFCGSNWFTTGEGQSMAEMAKLGMLD